MSHGRTLLVLLSLVILITAMKIDIKEEKPYRLPGDIIPEKYRLAVVTHMNDDEGFRFTGKVWIKVRKLYIMYEVIIRSLAQNLFNREIQPKFCQNEETTLNWFSSAKIFVMVVEGRQT